MPYLFFCSSIYPRRTPPAHPNVRLKQLNPDNNETDTDTDTDTDTVAIHGLNTQSADTWNVKLRA